MYMCVLVHVCERERRRREEWKIGGVVKRGGKKREREGEREKNSKRKEDII